MQDLESSNHGIWHESESKGSLRDTRRNLRAAGLVKHSFIVIVERDGATWQTVREGVHPKAVLTWAMAEALLSC